MFPGFRSILIDIYGLVIIVIATFSLCSPYWDKLMTMVGLTYMIVGISLGLDLITTAPRRWVIFFIIAIDITFVGNVAGIAVGLENDSSKCLSESGLIFIKFILAVQILLIISLLYLACCCCCAGSMESSDPEPFYQRTADVESQQDQQDLIISDLIINDELPPPPEYSSDM